MEIAMKCEFCQGTGENHNAFGRDNDECIDCDGTGLATCSECETTEDVVSAPDGPYYLCTDCLFVYIDDHPERV